MFSFPSNFIIFCKEVFHAIEIWYKTLKNRYENKDDWNTVRNKAYLSVVVAKLDFFLVKIY